MMKKLRLTALVLLLAALITACASQAAAPQKSLTSEQVAEAMRQAGVKLNGLHVKGGFPGGIYARLLDRVNPNTYSIDTYAMGLVTDEPSLKATDHSLVSVVNLSIYVFDSKAEREKGRKDFDRQMSARTALNDLHTGIYEQNNVLVIYFRDKDTEDIVDSDIREALETL